MTSLAMTMLSAITWVVGVFKTPWHNHQIKPAWASTTAQAMRTMRLWRKDFGQIWDACS
jgi:hypothetical protein